MANDEIIGERPTTLEEFHARPWKHRLYWSTSGKFHAIIACALGVQSRSHPQGFSGRASITSDGFVMCNFTDQHGEGHMGAFVGAFDDIQRNVDQIIPHLSMTPEEATAFRANMELWIGR